MASVSAARPSSLTLPAGVRLDARELARRASLPDSSLPLLAPAAGAVRLLTDEAQVLPQLLDAVGSARSSVDVSMFALDPSGSGQRLVDALTARARDGVDVRVTLDQLGSSILPIGPGSRMVDELRDAGVQVALNKRISGMRMQAVDHRKLLVVDRTTAFTGGMNLSARFEDWHDAMVRVEGPAAALLGAHFVDRWVDLAGAPHPGAPARVGAGAAGVTQAGHGVSLLVNDPSRERHATDFLLHSLGAASQRAYLLTPTLTDPDVVSALCSAAQRGVDVRVGVSGRDSWLGIRALGVLGSMFYHRLVNSGVQVFEQPGTSHTKATLVDDIATVGSLNLTRRSTKFDHELVVASDDAGLVHQVDDMVATAFARSTPVSAEQASGVRARIGDFVSRRAHVRF